MPVVSIHTIVLYSVYITVQIYTRSSRPGMVADLFYFYFIYIYICLYFVYCDALRMGLVSVVHFRNFSRRGQSNRTTVVCKSIKIKGEGKKEIGKGKGIR